MCSGLASAEGQAESSVLAAVGATPSQGRLLGCAQGMLLGLLGAAAGALLGGVASAALQVVTNAASAHLPWPDAVAAALAVPIVGGIAGAVAVQPRTRRRLLPRSD
jgi:ABC-type antimicrobial peptide transport system permease subunit